MTFWGETPGIERPARGVRSVGIGVALLALAGCAGSAPNDVSEGVGFSDYQEYQARREAMLNPPVATVPTTPTQTALPPADVTAEPFATVDATQPATSAWIPVEQTSTAPAATTATASTATADVAQIAAAAIDEVEASATGTALPPVTPSGDNFSAPPLPEGMTVLGANVVAFALSTDHAVGERVYSRFPVRLSRAEVQCSDFRTTDLAQDWFLTNEGPERDRAGLDPDGDGFACNWDPERYRAQARAANQPQPIAPAVSSVSSDG